MRVVSNTSPISNLAIIGRLDLLRAKYGRVIIPQAVRDELDRLSHKLGAAAIQRALTDGWLLVEPVADRRVLPVLMARVDAGEAEALELARQTDAELLIMDDQDGRQIAREESLPFTGLLGVLAEERLGGRLPSLKVEIDRLRSECRFFISAELERMLLERAGEA